MDIDIVDRALGYTTSNAAEADALIAELRYAVIRLRIENLRLREACLRTSNLAMKILEYKPDAP